MIHCSSILSTVVKEISMKLLGSTKDCLRLLTTAKHIDFIKYRQQEMNTTVFSLKILRSKTNHISSFEYGTLSPYLWLYSPKNVVRSNYSPIGGIPVYLSKCNSGKIEGGGQRSFLSFTESIAIDTCFVEISNITDYQCPHTVSELNHDHPERKLGTDKDVSRASLFPWN